MVRLQVPLPSSQCACLLSENTLLFLELPLYFPELLFSFVAVALCYLKNALLFYKIAP